MAALPQMARRDHRQPGAPRRQPDARALDPQPLSLPRPAQPRPGRAPAPLSRGRSRRAAIADDSPDDQRPRGRAAKQRLACLLSHPEELHFEYQRRVRRNDAARASGSVAHLRRNGELALAADFHPLHALVPALDDLALAEVEDERITAVLAGVEFRAIGEPAGVMHGDFLAGRGDGAGADDEIFNHKLGHGQLPEIVFFAQSSTIASRGGKRSSASSKLTQRYSWCSGRPSSVETGRTTSTSPVSAR